MRWSIIRLIWFRELRDQLRDRRTLFMIAVLPLLLYPILGLAMFQFTQASLVDRPSVVGVAGSAHLPGSALPEAAAWAAFVPAPATGVPLDVLGPMAVTIGRQLLDYPPLLVHGRVVPGWFESPTDVRGLQIILVPDDDSAHLKDCDLMLVVPSDFREQLEAGGRPTLRLLQRDDDERGRIAARRLYGVLGRWKKALRDVRLRRQGLPADYADPFELSDPEAEKSTFKVAAEGLRSLIGKVFPFLLVMWSLAGALYPAVDLCAGEKERGTMETLLISPASREEIVLGKFLTIWVFSFGTALLNLASMGLTAWPLGDTLTQGFAGPILTPAAVFWCVLLSAPTAAFFSALCLAMGAYARSSKEGQYYLMPLFLVTMPLIFLTLAPGVELNPFYSLVPVTGVALLLQKLMAVPLDQVPWLYFVPVLAPMALYSWIALRWAIEQFNREEVLFREAERLDLGLWLRRLFREKEPVPSTGEAMFCFGVLMALRWLSFGFGTSMSLPVRIGIGYLAFVAAPPLFMVLLLTTQPRQGLALRWPTPRAVGAALLLALLLLPPLSGLTLYILDQFPQLKELLTERNPMTEELQALGRGEPGAAPAWVYAVVLALLPSVCEELAFRGFILTGLRRRFRPWTAILLSSFLFAVFHANVFQFLPSFLLGAVLGVLAVRTGSILPCILFHLAHNALMIGLVRLESWLNQQGLGMEAFPHVRLIWGGAGLVCAVLAVVFLRRLSAFGYHRWAAEDARMLYPAPRETVPSKEP
jgi:sodium transport system permease protein